MVRTGAGETLVSSDGGTTFAAAPADTVLPPTGVVAIGSQRWEISSNGTVGHVANVSLRSAPLTDPGSPDLGARADLIASPAALPGVVVAVSTNGVVWRRGQDGDWKQALLLLPASLVQGVPRVTSVTAFTQPLSEAIYLSTDGYAVLISTDGGDDWIRAGPGLPDSVSSLSAELRAACGVCRNVRRTLGARAAGASGAACVPGRGARLALARHRGGDPDRLARRTVRLAGNRPTPNRRLRRAFERFR